VVPGSGVFNRFLWDDGGRLAGTETLEGGTTIERDADGWVIATTDERGRRLEYERDGLGRVVRVAIDGEPTIDAPSDDELERDPAGRLAIGSDGTLYRYDDAGRLAEIAPDGVEPTTFTYTVDGLVETEVGPRGRRSFGYDVAGRVVAVTIAGQGTTSIEYDDAGRRSREVEPDGATTTYEWNRSGRLVAIDRVGRRTGRVEITYDALDRPVAVDGIRVGYDPLSGRADRIGDHDFVHLGSARLDLARGEWQRPSDQEPLGGVPVDRVYVVGARVLDPSTRQFLSPDPLLAVVGSNGAASAYTYAWHDPINRVDPSGLRPISVEEADAMRTREELGRVGQFVEAIKEDPWGSLAAVGVVAAGVGLMFVPGGQAIGAGILIGAAMNAGVGFATGTFSPTGMAVSGAFGAIPGGSTFGSAVAIGAASGAGETVVTSVLTGQGFPPPGSIMTSATTGGAFGGGAHVLADLNPSTATANLDHTATPGSGLPEAIQFDGPVVRGSNPNYVDSAWDVGAHNIGQNHRYSGVGRSGVYAGTTTDVVAAELRHYDIAIDDVTVLTRDVQLNSVLDLTDPGARDALGVSLDAITGNDYEVTQAIGDLARSHGYDGILAPSARMDGGTNLVAFDGF
jgi:RHS repeat-associated protein